MGKLEKYSFYKDSEINPFLEFPNHWDIKRFKHLFSFGKGLNITKENLEETGVECVNYGEIHSKFGFKINPDIHKLKCVNESYLKNGSKSLLNIGDFVFADTSEDIEGSGNFTHLIGNKKIFAGYHTMICRPQKTLNSKFYAYLFDSKSFRSQLHEKVKGVKVYSITQNILKDTFVWIPEDIEQTKIASFLDEKTAQIDEVISQKEKLIELLKERKQIVINDAVTKGLNKNVEMVDSGVEWIGKIPRHWEIQTIKALFEERREMNKPIKTDNILSLCMYRGVIPYAEKGSGGNKAKEDLTAYKIAYPDDIVLNSMNVIAGSVGLSKYYGIVSPVYYMLYRRNKNDSIIFYNYIFRNQSFQKSLIRLGSGILIKKSESTGKLNTIRLKIPMIKLNREVLPYPPIDEQLQIAEYIENQTIKIDKAVELQQNYISKLKEYKSLLIDSVVTGKVRVV